MALDAEVRNALVEKEAKFFMDMFTPEYFEPEAKKLKKRIVNSILKNVVIENDIKDEKEIEELRINYENNPNFINDMILMDSLSEEEFEDFLAARKSEKNVGEVNANQKDNFEMFKTMMNQNIYEFLRSNYDSFEKTNEEFQEKSKNLGPFMSEEDSILFDKYSKVILNSLKKNNKIINSLVEIAEENGIEEAMQNDSINSAIKYVFPTIKAYKNFLTKFYTTKTKFAELIMNTLEKIKSSLMDAIMDEAENARNPTKVGDVDVYTRGANLNQIEIKEEANEEEMLHPITIIFNEASKLSGKVFKDYIEKRAKEIYE